MPFWTRPHLDAWDETAVAAGLEKVTLPDFDEPVRLHFHDLRGTTVTAFGELQHAATDRADYRPSWYHLIVASACWNEAGDEKGAVASTTNITSASKSSSPVLTICIGTPARRPGRAWPAATFTIPSGVFCVRRPVST
jgi:hypothetical protein